MRKWLGSFLLFFPFLLLAGQIDYPFSTAEQQTRFQTLTSELRCLVCQNQNLAESNAPLAADLRDKIYQQILLGQSNKEIIQFLVSRYGHFILYRPPLTKNTIGLWLGPFIILMLSMIYLFYYIHKKRRE